MATMSAMRTMVHVAAMSALALMGVMTPLAPATADTPTPVAPAKVLLIPFVSFPDDCAWRDRQSAINGLVMDLSRDHPADIAYWFRDGKRRDHLTVAFAGAVPPAALDMLKSSAVPFTLVEDVGFDSSQYEGAQNLALQAAIDANRAEVDADRLTMSAERDPSRGPGVIVVRYIKVVPDAAVVVVDDADLPAGFSVESIITQGPDAFLL